MGAESVLCLMKVKAYRNLNRGTKPHGWSIESGGKVIGYGQYIVLQNTVLERPVKPSGNFREKLKEASRGKRAVFQKVTGMTTLTVERSEMVGTTARNLFRPQAPISLDGFQRITCNPKKDIGQHMWGSFFYRDTGAYVDVSQRYTVILDDKYRCWIKPTR